MSDNTDFLNDGLMQFECELGLPTFTWNSNTYYCLASSDTEGATLAEGGFEISYDLQLTVRTNLFDGGITPTKQETLTYRGKTYRVLKVSADVTGTLLRIYGVSPYRMAR